jgi:hypothetical protein
MNRLLLESRRHNCPNFTPTEQAIVDELTPNDTQSVQIWNDRSYSKKKLSFNENLLNGKCGNFAFDNDMQRTNETRFKSNLDQ